MEKSYRITYQLTKLNSGDSNIKEVIIVAASKPVALNIAGVYPSKAQSYKYNVEQFSDDLVFDKGEIIKVRSIKNLTYARKLISITQIKI